MTTGILPLDGCACFPTPYSYLYYFVTPYQAPLLPVYCMICCPRIYQNFESLSLRVSELYTPSYVGPSPMYSPLNYLYLRLSLCLYVC